MSRIVVSAAALMCLAAPALAVEVQLPNGSFETGLPASNTFAPIASWAVSSVPPSGFASGVFTSYAGYSPSSGARMALITNSGSTFVTLRTPTPVAMLGNYILNFNFAFLTTDGTSTPLANRDQFQVVIDYFNDAAGLSQVGTQTFTVNTGNLQSTGVGVGSGQPWSNGTVLNGTRMGAAGALNPYTILLNLGTAPYAHIAFYLDNLGTSGASSVSGVLLDNVYATPEPGTFALFAFGAAGLGAAVWRRRKSAKKPAAS